MPDNWSKLLFWRQSGNIGSITVDPQKLDGKLRADNSELPIKLDIAGRILHLYPDASLVSDLAPANSWILIDAEKYFCEISGFIRIKPGNSLLVGNENKQLKRMFGYSEAIKNRHINIENIDGRLTFVQLDPDADVTLNYIDDSEKFRDHLDNRRRNLEQVQHIFGGPLTLLSPEESLSSLKQVNQILRENHYREKNAQGQVGGLVTLPDELIPIIVGDLHAQTNNLLKILSEGFYLNALVQGKACLILLGDTVHSEIDSQLEYMDSSALTLDLIFKLIIHLPSNVVYLRGNHESFENDVAKSSVPQGILFRKWLRDQRGQEYIDEIEQFFELLPYVVQSSHFIACHGGPPRRDYSLQDLINIAEHPELKHAITWNRIKSQRDAFGYRKKDIKRFRKILGVEKKTPFIVAHNPMSLTESFWLDAGDIRNHHIVYSAHPNNLAVFTRIGKYMLPFDYPTEPLISALKKSDS